MSNYWDPSDKFIDSEQGHTPPVRILPDPRELLAWLPYHLGFQPDESIVFVVVHSLSGNRSHSRIGLVARVDLDALTGARDCEQARAAVMAHLGRQHASRVLCVLYTRGGAVDNALARPELQSIVNWWLDQEISNAGDTYVVTPTRFRCLRCVHPGDCEPAGAPIEELSRTRIAAASVFAGKTFAMSRAELDCEGETPTWFLRLAQKEALLGATRAQHSVPAGKDSQWRSEMVRDFMSIVAQGEHLTGVVDSATEPTDRKLLEDATWYAKHLVALIHAFADSRVRDGALLWIGSGKNLDPAGNDEVIRAVFTGRRRPDPATVAASQNVLAVMSALATGEQKANVYAARAWLAWWSGDGARANIWCEHAQRLSENHTLARLLATVLSHGIPPGWARSGAIAS